MLKIACTAPRGSSDKETGDQATEHLGCDSTRRRGIGRPRRIDASPPLLYYSAKEAEELWRHASLIGRKAIEPRDSRPRRRVNGRLQALTAVLGEYKTEP